MPITVRPNMHAAEKIKSFLPTEIDQSQSKVKQESPNEAAIKALPPDHAKKVKDLIQTSWSPQESSPTVSCKNGLYDAVFRAYSGHHHLVLRPDDIWLAIVSQLSSFINAHSEELRGSFVSHEGKKKLVIQFDVPSYKCIPYDLVALRMTDMLESNLADKELRDWILPQFTTTTYHDTVCISVAMMALCQAWFQYGVRTRCGLPSVTLQGTKEDWQMILDRLDKLHSWGAEPGHFCELLKPILRRFVLSFDAPESSEVHSFWNRIVGRHKRMSGVTTLSGWLLAFFYWDKDGKRIFEHDPKDSKDLKGEPIDGDENVVRFGKQERLCLDGILYGILDTKKVPAGHLHVPLEIDNYGTIFNSTMVVGLGGVRYSNTATESAGDSEAWNTLSPYSAWWIYETTEKPETVDPTSEELRHIDSWRS